VRTRSLRPSQGRDARTIRFATTRAREPVWDPALASWCVWIQEATVLDLPGGKIHSAWATEDPDGPPDRTWIPTWWKQATAGRSTLLVMHEPERDLALLGEPPGWTRCEELREPFRMVYRRGQRRLEIIGWRNLYPGNPGEVSWMWAAEWVSRYVDWIRANDLGPKIEYTIARQSMLGLRRMLTPSNTLWWHQNPELHQFEFATARAQGITRITPGFDVFYPKLHVLDFTAFYVSIMANYPMPKECKGYVGKRHPLPPHKRAKAMWALLLDRGYLMLADVTVNGERRFLATPDLLELQAKDIEGVHRMAWYSETRVLQQWARKMWDLRQRAPKDLTASAKALGVTLWGHLCRQSYDFVPDTAVPWKSSEPDPDGTVWDHELQRMVRYDGSGNRLIQKPDTWKPKRFNAIGAHVLCHARRLMAERMKDVEVVYAHTDSIWSLQPVKGTLSLPYGLGGVDQGTKRNVEFRDGMRIVQGKVDAQPGRALHPDRPTWAPFDHPAVPEGAALFQVGGIWRAP